MDKKTAKSDIVVSEACSGKDHCRKQNKFLQFVLESLPHPFFVVDAKDYSIKAANGAATKGMPIEGMTCHELIHSVDEPCKHHDRDCPIQIIKKTRKPVVLDRTIKDKDGNVRYYEAYGYPVFDDDGKVAQIIEYTLDITSRKEFETALRQSKEVAEQVNEQLAASIEQANMLAQEVVVADNAKSQFLANMSHEIRTPMNAIIGFSDILSEMELNEEQRHYVDIIKQSGENMLALINDILDFSRIEAGKLDVDIIECSMKKIIAVTESLTRSEATKKNLDFEIRQCGHLPAKIRTDPVRLRQCLVNLINNAIKFTPAGHVHVSVYTRQTNNNSFICFDVEDTGIGIEPEKQGMIFESFVQADGATTRKFGGTGLGLAITKQLTNLLGGELTMTSELGAGSVFKLAIPSGVDIESQPALDSEEIISHPENREFNPDDMPTFTGNVLVAEDSQTNQMLIKLLLEKLGISVTIANDGKEALDIAMTQSFDLIFMDIQMPNINGLDATETLRRKSIETPIVALTAHAMKGDREKCLSAGCNDYITKPIDRVKLVKIIKKYLSSEDEIVSNKIEQLASDLEQTLSQAQSALTNDLNCQVSIDWDSLINTCGDEEVVKAITGAFLEDSPNTIESIAGAIETENAEDVRLYAHRLKGAAATIGASELAEKAFKLESAGKDNDSKQFNSLFEDIRSEFDRTFEFLSRSNWIEDAKRLKSTINADN